MNTERNIFEISTREGYRFPFKGSISVEDLWLLSTKDLDSIFKVLNSELKQANEESLLDVKTKQDEELDTKIEIVKHIVKTKVEEEEKRRLQKEISEQKQKILELIESKKDEDLNNKSVEELTEMLKGL